MRPLILLYSGKMGGAERQAVNIAGCLRKRGHDPLITMFSEDGTVIDTASELGVECVLLDEPGWSKRSWFRFVRALRRLDPDYLLPYCHSLNIVCSLLWRFTGSRGTIWNQRNSGTEIISKKSEKLAVRATSWIFSNSTEGSRELVAKLGAREDKIRFVRNGVLLPESMSDPVHWRTRLGIAEGTVVVGMLANIQSWKNHDSLLRAWVQVISRAKRPVHLILAGDHGNTWEPVKNLIAELNIGDRVSTPGAVRDIGGLLKTLDVSVLCSETEGAPNSLIESMLAGLPVLATAPECRWIVGDSQMTTKERLADALQDLVENEDHRILLGRENALRARKLFDFEANMTTHADMIETCMSGDIPKYGFNGTE